MRRIVILLAFTAAMSACGTSGTEATPPEPTISPADQAANDTACRTEADALDVASRVYHFKNEAWPKDVDTLTTEGHLRATPRWYTLDRNAYIILTDEGRAAGCPDSK